MPSNTPSSPQSRPASPPTDEPKGPGSLPLLFFGDFSKFTETEIAQVVYHNTTSFAQDNPEIIDSMIPSDFLLERENYIKIYFRDESSRKKFFDADMFVWEVPRDLSPSLNLLSPAPEFPHEGSNPTAVGVPAAEDSTPTAAELPANIEVRYKYPGDNHKMKQAPPPPSLFVTVPGLITRLAEKNQLSKETFISSLLAPAFPVGTTFTALSIPGRFRAVPPPGENIDEMLSKTYRVPIPALRFLQFNVQRSNPRFHPNHKGTTHTRSPS